MNKSYKQADESRNGIRDTINRVAPQFKRRRRVNYFFILVGLTVGGFWAVGVYFILGVL